MRGSSKNAAEHRYRPICGIIMYRKKIMRSIFRDSFRWTWQNIFDRRYRCAEFRSDKSESRRNNGRRRKHRVKHASALGECVSSKICTKDLFCQAPEQARWPSYETRELLSGLHGVASLNSTLRGQWKWKCDFLPRYLIFLFKKKHRERVSSTLICHRQWYWNYLSKGCVFYHWDNI